MKVEDIVGLAIKAAACVDVVREKMLPLGSVKDTEKMTETR